jgi:hypothetical protein
MRAVLRGFCSSDIEQLDGHRPDDPECFQIHVTAFIGPAEGRGEEMFDFTVCTAESHPLSLAPGVTRQGLQEAEAAAEPRRTFRSPGTPCTSLRLRP